MADDIPDAAAAGHISDADIARMASEQRDRLKSENAKLQAENAAMRISQYGAASQNSQPAPQPEASTKLFDVKDWRLTPAFMAVIVTWAMGATWWCYDQTQRIGSLELQNATYKEDRVKYREGVGAQITSMRDDLNALPNLAYRVAQLETVPGQLNQRMDRSFDVFNARFDTLAKNGADVSGDIKAMRQQIDSMMRAVDRLEGRRQDNAPFGRDQSWPYLQRDPYGLRARMGQELSPIVRRMALAEVGR